MNIYFGDLHNHCNISYGFGSLENALNEASRHLDFCTVTGHALWPDMYESNSETAFTVEFHKVGFKKLANNWEDIKNTIATANKEGEFVTFQSYEMHSSQYGDHHILSPDDSLELLKSDTPKDIINNLKQEAVAIPHHIAYSPGYRGVSWEHFKEKISPVVEVISKHGCGVSDESGGQYLHTMGPRDGRNTVYEGLRQGKKFGFTGSTDHHAGYPGSYGDGITAVLSGELTREAIWEAIKNRRTYALTGDRIRCDFTVDGNLMGSEIPVSDNHEIELMINSVDFIEKAVIYKNLKPIKAIHKEDFIAQETEYGKFKIRIETGWGRKASPYKWVNSIKVKSGEILSVDPCFRGQSVLAPKEGEEYQASVNKLDNEITTFNDSVVEWKCSTFKNPTTRHSATCSVVIEVEGSPETIFEINLNEKKISVSLDELTKHGISGHMQIHNSEAYLIHKAVPENRYNVKMNCVSESKKGDYFHAEVHQTNGQSAWISPVFIK